MTLSGVIFDPGRVNFGHFWPKLSHFGTFCPIFRAMALCGSPAGRFAVNVGTAFGLRKRSIRSMSPCRKGV